jgi:hypothetical protein
MNIPVRRRKFVSYACVCTLLLIFFATKNGNCQEQPVEIPRITNSVLLDGKVTDDEWEGIDTLSFISHWPVYTSKANSRTIFRIAYDDKFLYFSAICYDTPDLIQGRSLNATTGTWPKIR